MNDSPVGYQNRDLARPAGRVESPKQVCANNGKEYYPMGGTSFLRA